MNLSIVYDREMRLTDKNKTTAIILCQNKREAIVEYNLPESNEQILQVSTKRFYRVKKN